MEKYLKCNQCGGDLEITNQENIYLCKSCNSKQLIQSDTIINNFNFSNNYNSIDIKEKYKDDIAKIETYIKIKEYKKAYDLGTLICNQNPGDYYIWWLLCQLKFKLNANDIIDADREKFFQNAYALAPKEKQIDIENQYFELKNKQKNNISTSNVSVRLDLFKVFLMIISFIASIITLFIILIAIFL